MVEDLPDNYEYSMNYWPLHVTLADVFSIVGDRNDLIYSLREYLKGEYPIEVRVIGDEWFGDDKSVHVKLIDKTESLQQLHEGILDILSGYNAVFNHPEYTKKGFRSHSTVQKRDQLKTGDLLNIDSITLVDMYPNANPYKRRVIATCSLRL